MPSCTINDQAQIFNHGMYSNHLNQNKFCINFFFYLHCMYFLNGKNCNGEKALVMLQVMLSHACYVATATAKPGRSLKQDLCEPSFAPFDSPKRLGPSISFTKFYYFVILAMLFHNRNQQGFFERILVLQSDQNGIHI